jgi:hypothetical protein
MRDPIQWLEYKIRQMEDQYLFTLKLNYSNGSNNTANMDKFQAEKDETLIKINEQIKQYQDAVDVLKSLYI